MEYGNIGTKNKLAHGQLFKISPFKAKIKKTRPHKHEGYYELIFIHEGEGFHWLDTDHHQITAPEIYFLKPGSLHCWQFTSIPKGYVMLFKDEYFDQVRESNLVQLLQQLDTQVKVNLTDSFDPQAIFHEIWKEFRHQGSNSDLIIHGYLQALLARVLDMSNSGQILTTPSTSLHDRFLRLLPTRCPELHLVNQFAQILNTSPQNLNAACRKYTDKTAAGHISSQLLLEAKRNILHTDKNVSEIAYVLNFSDPSYFIKFFKRHTGLTPLQFRQQYFQ